MSTRSRQSTQRFSSPHAGTAAANGDSGAGPRTTQTFLDRWMEPPIRSVPSFVENGLERHGVVENMQPLGTMPSEKLMKSTIKTDGRKITLSKKPVIPSSPPLPPTEDLGLDGASAELLDAQPLLPTSTTSAAARRRLAEEDDEDYNPRGSHASSSRKTTKRSTASKSASVTATTPTPTATPAPMPTSARSSASTSASASVAMASPSPSPIKLHLHTSSGRKRTERVVQYACEQAITAGRIPTAYALQSLWEQERGNEHLMGLLESVYDERASTEEIQEFLAIVEAKKLEGARKQREGTILAGGTVSKHADSALRTSKYSQGLTGGASWIRSRMITAMHPPYTKSKGSPTKESARMTASPSAQKRRRSSHSTNASAVLDGLEALTAQLPQSPTPLNGTKIKFTAPTMTRARSESHSSVSSLSSMDEELVDQLNASSPLDSPVSGPTSLDHAHLSPQKSTTQHNPAASTMPAFYSESTPDPFQLPPTNAKGPRKGAVGASNASNTAEKRALPPNDEHEQRKKRARLTTNSVTVGDSFLRGDDAIAALDDETLGLKPLTTGKGGKSAAKSSAAAAAATARRGGRDGQDGFSSPTNLSFQPDLAPGSSLNSRAGTPVKNGRVTRKAKTGPRTKSSPMKKKSGPLAGIARQSGERGSPAGNGVFNADKDENDDFCSSCGGNGDLLCCDGCTRSFHFSCVDPPMTPEELPEHWYCNVCDFARAPPERPVRGAFSLLQWYLAKKNPQAFALPKDVRNYFEGVNTGPDGEYEEPAPNKQKTRGYDEQPDFLKLRDNKGNTIVCHSCHQSALEGRLIVPCGFCGLSWHLDCLDPPMANPPPLGRAWKCPCHIDDLLAHNQLGPAHRPRKIKGSKVIKPYISRGIKNNGIIEIENDAPDDFAEPTFVEHREWGRVYQLPETGVKLDFIEQINRKSGKLATKYARKSSHARLPPSPPIVPFDRRGIEEQQAALNLAQLGVQSGNDHDKTQILVDALMAEASPDVIALIAQGDASRLATGPSRQDKQSLLAMKAFIEAQLSRLDDPATMDGDLTTIVAQANRADLATADKVDSHNQMIAQVPSPAETSSQAPETTISAAASPKDLTEATTQETVTTDVNEDVDMVM